MMLIRRDAAEKMVHAYPKDAYKGVSSGWGRNRTLARLLTVSAIYIRQ